MSSDLPEFEFITFNINGILTMPTLLKEGYFRPHITMVFEELHKKGFGIYEPGKRGPGCCAKFTPNETCPAVYKLVVPVKTTKVGRPRLIRNVPASSTNEETQNEIETSSEINEQEQEQIVTPVSAPIPSPTKIVTQNNNNNIEYSDDKNLETHVLHSLFGLSKTIIRDQSSSRVGYECSVFADQLLVLHRIRGGGKDTIESAVKLMWDKVATRIVAPKMKHMNKFQYACSILRGASFLVLCPVGCLCGADQTNQIVEETIETSEVSMEENEDK